MGITHRQLGSTAAKVALAGLLLIAFMWQVALAWNSERREVAEEIEVQLRLIDEAEIASRETGIVMKRHVQLGDRVQTGDILVSLDDAEARLTMELAKVEMEIAARQAGSDFDVLAARAARDLAASNLQRRVTARGNVATSVQQEELDEFRVKAEQAQIDLDRAEFTRETARLLHQQKQTAHQLATERWERRQIRAPFNGIVVQVFPQVGEAVTIGDPVVRMIGLERLGAEALVDASRFPRSLVGTTIQVVVGSAEDSSEHSRAAVKGRITFISPEQSPLDGKTRLMAEIENPGERLNPGQIARLRLTHEGRSR